MIQTWFSPIARDRTLLFEPVHMGDDGVTSDSWPVGERRWIGDGYG